MVKQTRRTLLKATAAAPLAAGASTKSATVYTSLGVKPVINGMGTVTILGGSLMPPEVVRAMEEAAQHFIHLPDLQKKAGARLAELLKVPGAMVTCGAASGITLAAAACIARGNARKLRQLPDSTGMPFEVIQQKSHRSGYEHQMTVVGAKIVTIETADELESAISPRTAMLFFLNKADPGGRIKRAEWIAAGKRHNVPTFNDAAADVPPKENLWKYVHDGFDLVAFSGGKGLRGPQSAGLLLGRADLIEAAYPAMSPSGGIGRGMKVSKEEIVGMVAAVERYLKVDRDTEARELDRRVAEMAAVLKKFDGVRVERHVPEIANEVPHLAVEWDEAARKLTAQQVHDRLRDGDPSIWVLLRGKGRLLVSVWMMRGDEHRIVARRIAEILRG